jgi:hypothetical protein
MRYWGACTAAELALLLSPSLVGWAPKSAASLWAHQKTDPSNSNLQRQSVHVIREGQTDKQGMATVTHIYLTVPNQGDKRAALFLPRGGLIMLSHPP